MSRLLLVALVLATTSARADQSPFLERARGLAGQHGTYLVSLARETLHQVVQDGNLEPAPHGRRPTSTVSPFGVFVTLVKAGKVRGCFGFMESRGRTFEDLVVEAALGAARFDPRSRPVGASELGALQVIVSLVGPSVPVVSIREVDNKRHGLLVRAGSRASVLLPGEARTARWLLRRNLRQAGIAKGEPYEMFRFRTVTVYERGF